MTIPSAPPATWNWYRVWQVWAVAGFVAVLHVIWWYLTDFSIDQHQLIDGDSYARLLRLLYLFESGDWLDVSLPRANAPYGGSLHWPRLLDILVLAFTLPFLPFVELNQALYLSCVIIGPIQHIILAILVVWAARPLIDNAAAYIAGALTTVQVGIFVYSAVGRADHHVLFALFFVISLGYMARALMDISSHVASRQTFIAGVSIAIGIWVGPEALFLMAICLCGGGLPWLAGNIRAAALNRSMLVGIVLGLIGVIIMERGFSGFADIQYDRVSIVHLVLSTIILLFWIIIERTSHIWEHSTVKTRLFTAIIGSVVTIVLLLLLFPLIYLGPMANVDPVFRDIFKKIMEFASITDIPHFVLYLGTSLIALPWVIYRIYRNKEPENRWAWCLFAIGMLVYIPLTLDSIRSCIYTGLFSTILVGDLIVTVDRYINSHYKGIKRSLYLASALILLTVGPFALGGVLVNAKNKESKQREQLQKTCSIGELSKHMNNSSLFNNPVTILTSPNFGPEIMYRTHHNVLGTMHHPNTEGIKAAKFFMESLDEELPLRIIRERKVDYLLICEDSGNNSYVDGIDNPLIMINMLTNNKGPKWVFELPLSDNLHPFRLFQVNTD